MNARTKNEWTVTLQGSDGKIVEYPFAAYWKKDDEDIDAVVGNAAAAQAWSEGGKTTEYQPVATALVS
jgi:hypothetical protein